VGAVEVVAGDVVEEAATVVVVSAVVVVVAGTVVVEVVDVSVGPGFDDSSVVHAAPTTPMASASATSRRGIIGWSP
jgi:hypothetical protein